MSSGRFYDVEWVVACLAPRDIAPHPNFRVDDVRPAELLALLVELDRADYDHYRNLLDAKVANGDLRMTVELDLLDAAKSSLEAQSITEGLRRLVVLARNQSISIGKRTAAALLASLAGTDQDNIEPALIALRELYKETTDGLDPKNATAALTSAALAQQIAIRSLEAGRYDDALKFAEDAVQCSQAPGHRWENFTPSKGIGWSAEESQRRILSTIQANALSLSVAIQDGRGNSWADIVRATPPPSEIRPLREVGKGLGAFLDEQFKEKYPSTATTTIFRGSDAVLTPLYTALISAEMLGSLHALRLRREEVGQAQAVLWLGEERRGSLDEALRLLRQADADEGVRRILRHVRQVGPLALLKRSAAHILERSSFLSVSPIELAIMEAASDLLGPEERKRALKLALEFPEKGSEGRLRRRRPTFRRRMELCFRAVEALALHGELDAYVASHVLERAKKYQATTDQTLFGALVRVASSINWSAVPEEIQRKWRGLLDAVDPTGDVLANDVLALAKLLGQPIDHGSLQMRGIDGVAALVNGWIAQPAATDLEAASALCLEYLQRIQHDAESGSMSGYLYSPTALASHMIVKYDRSELWPALLALLQHPLVATGDKAAALSVLMHEEAPSSEAVQVDLRSVGLSITSGRELDNHFDAPVDELDNLWRIALLAQGALTFEDIQSELVRLSAHQNARVRSRIADAISRPSKRSLPDWGVVLLLQLSHDRDSTVRHHAARGLGYIGWQAGLPISSVARARVVELLSDEGISSAMGALRGLIEYKKRMGTAAEDLWCAATIAELANSHPSSHIRLAATAVLESN